MTVVIVALGCLFLSEAHAAGNPSGGRIVSGAGSIDRSGSTTTILQGSQTLQLQWQSFDIGAGNTVNFVQPGSSALAVNRIAGSMPSAIFGRLNANGQVWLINPNGVLFGPSAQVNVGGIVASALDVQPDSIQNGDRRFFGAGQGSVVNQGTIRAANGGYVALLGNTVSNQGVISARMGTIALAGGRDITLTFDKSQLVHVVVNASTMNNLAENRQLLVADGGQVIITAGARDALLASAVNNTGEIRARTVEDHQGTIVLLGGMEAGHVDVGGTLDASAPSSGNGGSIETSAAHVGVAQDARITAAAPGGKAGTWLVDPTDLTIDATAASGISSTLQGGTNVVEQTTASGVSGGGVQSSGAGDINVDAPINWTNPAASLTLEALNAINVNAGVTGAGAVTMQAGTGNLTIASGASIAGGAGVVLATGANFVNNAGSAAVSTGTSSSWLVYSTDPRLNTAGGLAPAYVQYNAAYPAAPAASGNGFLYSLAPTITTTALTGNVTKVYDGTPDASLTGSNLAATGLVNGDVIQSATGTYATSDAGSAIRVTSPGSAANLVVTDSTGTIPVFGYKASGSVSADIGTITRAPLTANIVNNPTKVYDGTASASLTSNNFGFTGFVDGQGVTVGQASSVSYASADAGTGIPLNARFISSNFVANSGTNLRNYILPTSASGTGVITPAPLIVTGIVANDKVYDGTSSGTINVNGASLFGLISADGGQVALNASGATGTFASPNAGTEIPVTATGLTLTGPKAANYTVTSPPNLFADITPRLVTITGVTAANKVYDSTTTATLDDAHVTISGLVPADAGNVALSANGVTASFGQSNVGNGLAVSASGFALTGSAAGNYSVAALTGITANITPAPLRITFTGTPTKVYDGSEETTFSQSNYSISGFAGGQSAVIGQASSTYASPNAGSGIAVTSTLTASDFLPSAGTSISNYSFPATLTTTAGVIRPAPVVVSLINNPSKVFDGTATATLGANNYAISGAIPGESIGLNPFPTSGEYGSANAGLQSVSTALSNANFSAGAGTLLSNYLLPTVATGFGTIAQKALGGQLAAAITNNPFKTYDGTTAATIPAGDFALTGFVGSDSATVSRTITGEYASKNAGQQPVQANLSTADLAAGPGTNLNNYTFPVSASGLGTILPAPLTVTIIGNPTKIYNGDAIASLSSGNFGINGLVNGESAIITPSTRFNYATANAGTPTITGSLVPGNYTAGSGTSLSNYILPTTASGPGTITPAPLHVLNAYATDKVYDATSSDTLDVRSATLSGLVASDEGHVTLNTTTAATFAQPNAGRNIAVTTTGFSISGEAAGNYALQQPSALSANITPLVLGLNGAVANNKVYDGTTTASVDFTNATLAGVLGADSVTFSPNGGNARFLTPNVGNSLSVVASGYTLSGPSAGNYSLAPVANLRANITPAPLSVTITGDPVKQYDGTSSVTLGSADFTITGFVGNQRAAIVQTATSGYFSSNAGTQVGLSATLESPDYVAAAGTNLSNYQLPTSASGALGRIIPAVIDLTGTRTYDGTSVANQGIFAGGGAIAGVNGETLTLSGSGVLTSKNVGRQIPFAPGSLALGNGSGLASNYTLAGGTDWVTITPATLTVLNTTAQSRVYDGTQNATLANALLNGVATGDDVVLGSAGTGAFASKVVGTNKPVSTQMTISGTDAGNYVLVQPTGITASITPLAITVGATANNRQYDGTTAAQVRLSSAGVLAGDTVAFGDTSANFAQANAGNGVPVTVGGIAVTGADAGNYTLVNNTAGTSANITPRVLSLKGARVYDATTTANASLFGNNGTLTGVSGQTLALSGMGSLSNKNVGTQRPFASGGLAGFTLTGNGTALASNYTLTGGTDWVTITPATLQVTGAQASNKTYDGTASDVLSGAALAGVIGSDNVTLGNSTAGAFGSKSVGSNKSVSTSMTLSGADAANYRLVQPTGLSASIAPRAITVNATGVNRVYNGTTTAQVNLSSPGVVAGDKVTFTDTSAGFAQANVGNGIPVTVLGIASTGADAANYTLGNAQATTSANITPYVLSLHGTRVYDATTGANASLFGSNGVLSGVAGQTLTLSGSGALSTKNVGTQKPFASGGLAGFALAGNGSALASNYTLTGGTDWVTITPATLTVTGTTVRPKIYDATTAATLTGATLAGTLGSDSVSLGNATTGTFASKNAGNDIVVTPSPMTIGGADAANYTLVQPATLAGVITPRPITVGATAQNKTYDGTNSALVTVAGSGVLVGDTVNFGYGSALFNSPNAGTNIGVTVSGITESGASAGNYTVNPTAATTANIVPAILNLTGTKAYDGGTDAPAGIFGNAGVIGGVAGETLTLSGTGTLSTKNAGAQQPFATNGLAGLSLTGNGGVLASNYTLAGGIDEVTIAPLAITVAATGQDKTYDATASATATLGSRGVIAGDSVSFAYGTARFGSPDAGTGVPVTVSGITASGTDAANYAINTSAQTSANINPAVLTLTGARVYDGTSTATANLFGDNGVLTGVAGQTLTLSGAGTLGGKDVGPARPFAANGLDGFTLTGNGAALASNYTLAGGIDSVSITPKPLTITAIGQNKTYDGTTAAQLDSFTVSGLVPGDDATVGYGAARFTTANAGTGIPVAVSNLFGSGADIANYSFANSVSTNATITPAVLSLTGTRVYNGSTDAPASLFGNDGVLTGVAGQTLTLSGTGTLSTKNAGTQQPLSVSGVGGFDLAGNNGALASNYTLAGGVDWVTITPLAITLVPAAQNKTYDGTVSAQATLSATGVLPGDSVTLGYSMANFSSPNAGNGIPVQLSGIQASGADAGNYSVPATVATSANIAPAVLNLTGSRVYDGTTGASASLFGDNGLLTGVDGETLTLNGTAALSGKNVGTEISFGPDGTRGYTLTGNQGAQSGNYTLAGGVDWVNITPRALTLTFSAQNKTYDATNAAQIGGFQVSGLVPGDSASFTHGAATFSTPNAGNDIQVTLAGITGTGRDLGNYSFSSTATASANILPVVLNLTGSRPYDGTNQADAGLFGNGGQLAGIDGQTLTLSGAATLPGKNVGTQVPFAGDGSKGLALTGNGAALANNYTLIGGIDWITVTPRAITVTATGASKVYDGSTAATVSLGSSGIIGGDNVSFNARSAAFATPDAGNGVGVAVTGIAGAGADAGNYTFNTSANTVANIRPAVLVLSGSQVYTASPDVPAGIFGVNGVLTGVNGETLTLSGTGTLSNKNVGVRAFGAGGLAGFTLTGNDGALASNYTLAGGADRVTITPARLLVVGTKAGNMDYSGSLIDTLSGATLFGVLGGDHVTLVNGTVGYFQNASVGNSKAVTTDMSLGGVDAGNYLLVQPTGLVANLVAQSNPMSSGPVVSAEAMVGTADVSTPYGTASDSAIGSFAGNQKRQDKHDARNATRGDFLPGLALTVINGGVRLPSN